MGREHHIEVALGDLHLDSHGNGLVVGALLIIPFDNIASVGNSAVNTTKQARIVVNRRHRLRGFYGSATAKAGTTNPTFDLFAGAATALGAALTIAAADTVYTGAIATPAEPVAAGKEYSVRTITAADGTITNLQAHIEIELLPETI